MTRRQYSDNDKAAALAALDTNDGNVYKTAQQLGIPRKTLESWANNAGVNDDVANLRQHKKGEIADRLEDLVHQLIDAMPGKIGDANLQQAATTLGIAVEKIQLLRGKPTDRTVVTDELTDDERAKRIAAILDRARTRRDGRAADD